MLHRKAVHQMLRVELSIIPMPLELWNFPGCGTFGNKIGPIRDTTEWLIILPPQVRRKKKKRSHSWNRNSQLPRLIDKERSFKLWDVFVSHGFLSSHSQPGILRFERTNNHIDYIRNKFIAVACYLLRNFFPWTLKCLLKNNHLRLEMTLITQHLQVIELTVSYQHPQPGIKSFCFLIG